MKSSAYTPTPPSSTTSSEDRELRDLATVAVDPTTLVPALPTLASSPASMPCTPPQVPPLSPNTCANPLPVPTTHPRSGKRERSRQGKPPRGPSPSPSPLLSRRNSYSSTAPASSPVAAASVQNRVAKLLESYLEKTLGVPSSNADARQDKKNTSPATDTPSEPTDSPIPPTNPDSQQADAAAHFRLFADSTPGTLHVSAERASRRVRKKLRAEGGEPSAPPVDSDSSTEEDGENHMERLRSVVVSVQPPSTS